MTTIKTFIYFAAAVATMRPGEAWHAGNRRATDIRGLTVMRRDASGTTYFIHDGLGDLRYVLPPGIKTPESRANTDMQRLAYWYDSYGNEIQRCASGYNVGRRSRRDFDFAGNPAAVVHDYAGTGYGLPALTEEYVRDAAGRLTSSKIKFDGTVVASASMFPDAAGNLRSALLGGKIPVRYTYDVHGWPLTMTATSGSEVFHESLMYDGGKNPCFNGNISSRVWHSGRYDYSYDASNRLVRADFTAPAGAPEGTDFSAAYAYDARGNITSLVRDGVTERLPAGAETFGTVTDRSFTYAGNRLTRVNDHNVSVGPAGPVIPDITPSAALYSGSRSLLPSRKSLSYDDTGRLTADETRGISSVAYNNDGLPTRVNFDDGARHTYIYDGLGRLVEAVYEAFVPVASNPALGQLVRTGRRRYTGDGHVISPDVALLGGATDVLTYFPGGHVDAAGRAHYHITDYRGSVMAVVRDDGAVVQRTDYYPYGMPWRPASGDNARLFEGKEYLAADGLDEYDYLARRYAPEFVHFTTPDPLASKTPWFSPYCPFGCNPVMNVDPDGMEFTAYAEGAARRLYNETMKKINATDDTGLKAKYLQVIKEFGDMWLSSQLFDVENAGYDATDGYTYYNTEKNAVVFALPGANYAGYDIIAHEFKHGHQFINGEIDLAVNCQPSTSPILYDIYDEFDAYERGSLFDGISYTKESIENDPKYDVLLKQRTDVHSLGGFPNASQPLNVQDILSKQCKRLSKTRNRAFRANYQTFIP